jgi:uncharacterized surface protein with fasciclin (FAS1) repeats
MSYRNTFIALAALAGLAATPAMADCCSKSSTVARAETTDIVATATSAGQFKTLLAALDAAGLTSALQGAGPFTVFAPTDAAFAKLPKGAVDALLKDPEKLKAVLTYHVVPGNLKAADVLGGAALVTLQGEALKATLDGSTARVDGAAIVTTDLECSNGVVHVIDTVLMP